MATIAPLEINLETIMVTDHSLKRYWERVPESNDLSGPQVEAIIRQRMREATFLFFGSSGNSAEASFYIHDDMIFVVKENAVVTLYKAEYGLGTDVDGVVRRKLLAIVKGLHARIARAEQNMRDMYSRIDTEIFTIEDRMRVLVAEVRMLEDARAVLEAKRKQAASEKATLEARLQEEVAKLVQSKRYNTEMLAAMRTLAQNGKR